MEVVLFRRIDEFRGVLQVILLTRWLSIIERGGIQRAIAGVSSFITKSIVSVTWKETAHSYECQIAGLAEILVNKTLHDADHHSPSALASYTR